MTIQFRALLRTLPRTLPLLLAATLDCPPAIAAETASCKYVKIAELPLRFHGHSLEPMVDGSINGARARMLVDTGAQHSFLTNPALDKFNLNARPTSVRMEGIGGSSRMYSAQVSEFSVGPTRSRGVTMGVIGDMGVTPDYDALVGADFLFQADVEIALTEHALRFFRPLECGADSFLAYWTDDAVVVPLTGSFGRSKNNTFTVKLNGVELDAIIDTGAERTVVFEHAARKSGVRENHGSTRAQGRAGGIGSELISARSAVFSTFAVGGETIRDAELLVVPDSSALRGADILLGADFLRSHRVLFAMSQRQLYISYLGGDVFSRDAVAIPAWLRQEADGGNPDAMFALAARLIALDNAAGSATGSDAQRGQQALALLERAAALHHRPALLGLAALEGRLGRFNESVALYARAAALQQDDRRTWLMLYLARLNAGTAGAADIELTQRLAQDKTRAWPAPVGDYYLGRIDAAALLKTAAADSALAAWRSCDAKDFMAQLAQVKGDSVLLKTLTEQRSAECKADAHGAPGR